MVQRSKQLTASDIYRLIDVKATRLASTRPVLYRYGQIAWWVLVELIDAEGEVTGPENVCDLERFLRNITGQASDPYYNDAATHECIQQFVTIWNNPVGEPCAE